MGTIATLAINIIGNTKALEASLSKAQQSLKSASDSLSNLGGKLTAGVSLPLLGVGGAALKAAADNEQLQVAFTTMLGSADKATSLMKDLSTFAAATPFESSEIQQAAKMLLAYGSDAGTVTEEMRQLGDIAAGVGAPLGDIAYLYGTARTQGRLFTADINQFTSRGIPIMEALSATMGVATSEIRGMVEEGKVGFPELQAALAYLTGEGGKFSGLMEAQSTTLLGLASTLMDNVALTMVDVGNAIAQAFDLKNAAAGAIAFVESIRNTISDLAKNNPQLLRMGVIIAAVAAAIGPLVVGLGMVVGAVAPLVPLLGALVSPVGLLVAGFAALVALDIGGLGTMLSDLGRYLRAAVEDGDYLNDWLTHLPELIQPAVMALGRIVGAVAALVQTGDMGAFVNELRAAFPQAAAAVDMAAAAFGGFRQMVGGVLSQLRAFAERGVSALGAALNGLPAMLSGSYAAFSSFRQQASALGAAIISFFAPAVARLQRAFAGLPSAVASLLPKLQQAGAAFGGLLSAVQPVVAFLGGVLIVAADWAVNALTAAFEALPNIVGSAIDQVTATLQLVTTALSGIIAIVRAAIAGDWTAAWESAKEIGAGFVVFFQGLLSRLGELAGTAASVIADPILDTLSDLGLDARGALGNVGEALADAWDGVAEAFAPVMGAIDGLRAALGSLMQTGDLGAFVQSIISIDWGAALGAMSEALGSLASGVVSALQGIDWAGALATAGDWLGGLTAGVVGAITAIDWGGLLVTAGDWLGGLTQGVIGAITAIDWGGTVSGAFATLETATADALRGLGFEGAADALDGLASSLAEALPEAATAAQAAMGSVSAALYSAKNAFDGTQAAVSTFLATNAWTTAQADITTALSAIGASVAGVFTGDVSLSELRDSLVTQFGEIGTALSELFASDEFAALGTNLLAAFGLDGLPAQITAQVEPIQTAFQPLVDFLAPSFDRLKETVGRLPEQFGALGEKFGPLKDAALELGAAIGGLFSGGGEGGGALGVSVMGAALSGTLSLLTNTVNGLLGALAPLSGAFIDELTTVLSGLATVVEGLGTAFAGIVANDPTLVLQGLGTAFQGVKDIVTGTFENSLTAVQTALTAIGEIVTTTLGDWGFGAAATAVDTMVTSINTLLEKIKAIASDDSLSKISAPDWLTDLLDFSWPEIKISVPDWLTDLLDFSWPAMTQIPWWLGGPAEPGTENQAVGTSYFSGGYVNASETGPEVAILPRGVSWLPRGTQILNGRDTANALAGAGGGVTVVIQNATFRNERDMQRFAYEIDDLMQRRKR